MVLELEDLSHDITESVTKHLNPIDLIELSFVSKEWECLIKSFKIHIRELYFSLRGMTGEEAGTCDILFGLKPVQKSFIHFFFYKRTEEQILEISEDPKTVSKFFDGKEFKCQVNQAVVKVYSQNPIESFYSVMDHLLLLFNGPIHHVHFAYCTPLVDHVTFRILNQKPATHCYKLTIPTGRMISDNLLKLILAFPNLHVLRLQCTTNKRFMHYKQVNIRHFYICFAEWMTRRSLFCLNCEVIDLGDPRLTLKDLNAYIKKWLDEDTKVLKKCSISFCHGWNWDDEKKEGKELFEGIEWKKWDPKFSSRPKYFPDTDTKSIDCEDGRDIVRSDGALATIKCDQFRFLLLVWSYPS